MVISPVSKNKIIKLKYLDLANVIWNDFVYHNPIVYTEKNQASIINEMLDGIGYVEGMNLFIEATTINSSYWAEIIAKKTGGTAFSYLLHSHIDHLKEQEIEFFEFKYQQKLLAGMTENTLRDIFSQSKNFKVNDYYSFKADGRDPLTNEIEKCAYYITDIQEKKDKGALVIGYFGTLNKPHIYELSNRIVDYVNKHPNRMFVYVTIGSSENNRAEKYISHLFKDMNNVVYVQIEEMYPVPINLFKLMDVCIGSWGSARTASRTGVKTIRLMGDTDVVAQGIIGITLRNNIYYDLPCGTETLEDYLDNILFHDTYDAINNNSIVSYRDYEISQVQMDEFLMEYLNKARQAEYFPINDIKRNKNEIFIKIANYLLDYKLVERIRLCIKKRLKVCK